MKIPNSLIPPDSLKPPKGLIPPDSLLPPEVKEIIKNNQTNQNNKNY